MFQIEKKNNFHNLNGQMSNQKLKKLFYKKKHKDSKAHTAAAHHITKKKCT